MAVCCVVDITKVAGGDLQMFVLPIFYYSLNNVVTCFIKNKHNYQQ